MHPNSASGPREKRARGREVGPHTQQTPFTRQVPPPSQLQSPCPPGGDITMPFCFPHVAMTRLSGGYLHRSTLRNRTLGANQRFFLLLCLGPIFVNPGRIPDFADGVSCLISAHSVSDSLMACWYKEGVALQKRVYHVPLLTCNRGGTGETLPNADLQSWI